MGNFVRRNLIIRYLKDGFYIRVLHDHTEQKVYRELTDGENDIMTVQQATIDSMLRKQLIEERGSWTPCTQIDIQKFRWKSAAL
jgi:hypothetical protein